MSKKLVCGECNQFANEDVLGNGWCEFHQKETFCENESCKDSKVKCCDSPTLLCSENDVSCDSAMDKPNNTL